MLMSKNWMTSVWSWDHAFNAMAASLGGAPKLAWNQFILPIDAQASTGVFPDRWDADSMAWEFSKPPIHGWALEWMLRHGAAISDAELSQVYEPLERWTDWFFDYRDSNGNGLPEYRHGDESGWDNSTVFREGGLVESPDLSAYLVVQMDALMDIATRLGKPEEARHWKARADQLFTIMMRRFWNGRAFVAFDALDGKEISSRSLLLTMPLVLGVRLPMDVREALVADLKARAAQSPFGLPSEPPDSPFYEADGYWRGPIWTPATMILADALDRIGEHAFANALRMKFCRMAQQSGLAENFDALDGRALRDPAYTWTSSVYLLFAHELIIQGDSDT
jgi:glycogen debranching enzyme